MEGGQYKGIGVRKGFVNGGSGAVEQGLEDIIGENMEQKVGRFKGENWVEEGNNQEDESELWTEL